jgi:hypothetical protein
MSTGEIIRIAIESLVCIAVVVACFFEPAIAEWEERQKAKVLRAFKERNMFRK